MRRILWIVAAATTALTSVWACGGGESTGETSPSTTSTTTGGAGGAGSSTSAGASSSTGGDGKVCAAGTLCLQVKPVDGGGTLASGRVAVVWYPFDDATPTPPLIAYDVPFDPATTRIDIPYQSLVP